MPRKIFVLAKAKTSKPFDIFFAKICVIITIDATNATKISIEKTCNVFVIIKNQNENPIVTVIALNLGDESSISNWIN